MNHDVLLFILNTLFCVFFIVGVCLNCGYVEVPDDSYNVTEHIVSKDKVYTYRFMDNGFEYFIFTEDYCFSVDIGVYNRLSVNDSVVVTVDNGGLVYCVVDGHRYFEV